MSDAFLRDLPNATTTASGDRVYLEQGTIGSETARRATLAKLGEGLGSYHVEAFGAVGDGVTDDAAAFQAAIDAAEAAGGGVVMVGFRGYAITGSDLVIKSGVTLRGRGEVGGWRPNGTWSNTPQRLLLSPARTIRVRRNAALEDLALFRQGFVAPTSVRTALDAVLSFAGTAVSLGDGTTGNSPTNGTDTAARRLLLIGFANGIVSAGASRVRVEDVLGDCTNGLRIVGSFDVARTRGVNFHPLATTGYGWTGTTWAISAVQNNGLGAYRLMIAAHQLQTGDVVSVYGTLGAPGLNGRWTVTVINATTVDLQGSTFAAGYTSGGVVDPMVNRRAGTGFYVEDADWPQFTDCMEYGHDVGWHLGPSAVSVSIENGPADALNAWVDPFSVGLLITGNSNRNKVKGQNYSSKGVAVRVNSTSPDTAVDLYATMLTAGDAGRCVEILDGSASLHQCDVYGAVYMANAAESLTITACDLRGTTFVGESAAAVSRIKIAGNREPISSLLRLAGGDFHLEKWDTATSAHVPIISSTVGTSARVHRRSPSSGAQIVLDDNTGATAWALTASVTELFLARFAAGAVGNVVIGPGSGATAAQALILRSQRAAPAPNDVISTLAFRGNDSALLTTDYATIQGLSAVVTDGAETGELRFVVANAGTLNHRAFTMTPTGLLTWDGRLISSGTGSPEGVVTAIPGSLFLSSDGLSYSKATGTGNTGWVRSGFNSDGSFSVGALRIVPPGTGSPEGVVTAARPALYVDQANGNLWTKTTASGNTGWLQIT